ncbi:efflux RND transporter periplasmic adaptor subunit [Aureibacillus halotolerans]|uniref:RND family efflux transporter MFP subunit n=1 Tax=Aureibacillus halotolerans TaxID=1508390 RepID=A0A4R6TVU0_9BACI|nr:efflux RND transporter periplasmic adaptor subunit [Aureibacillus halotolerans]TDQ36109.1 RND family efflux transporter MFP subunit [Aureibacillus halotolerans]
MKRTIHNRLLLVLAATLLFITGCTSTEGATGVQEEKRTPVKVATIEQGNMATTKEIVANMFPNTEVNVMPKVQGQLVSVNVQKGDVVQKGAVLGKVDDKSLQQQVELNQIALQQAQTQYDAAQLAAQASQNGIDAAKNQLVQAEISIQQGKNTRLDSMSNNDLSVDQARTQWKSAQEDIETYANLYREGAVSYQEYQQVIDAEKQAKIALDQAQIAAEGAENTENVDLLEAQKNAAQIGIANAKEDVKNAANAAEQARIGVQQAQTQLKQSKSMLEDPVIYAPITGEVAAVNGKAGEMVSASNPFVTIVNLTSVTARSSVTGAQLSLFEKNQDVEVTIRALDQSFTGTVSYIAATAAENGLFTVEATVPNDQQTIKPGMVGEIVLTSNVIDDAILVPTEAVVEEGDAAYIFVVEDDKAVQKEVELLEVQSDQSAIKGDVVGGATVIIQGQNTLTDGSLIRIMEEGE